MGKFNLNSGVIQNFDVNLTQETNEGYTFDVIYLRICSETVDVSYRINSDERHPNINIIYNSLKVGLQQAQNSDLSFEISEYLERSYIFVTYPDGQVMQYTAQRI